MFKTKEELLEWINKELSNSGGIFELDLSQDNCVFFKWKYVRWKIYTNGNVEEGKNGVFYSTFNSLLMEELLKQDYTLIK